MGEAALATGWDTMTTEDNTQAMILSRSIEEIGLSVRSANCLRAAQVRTVGDLLTFTAERLLRLPNFGRTSLEDVDAALADHRLKLVATPSTMATPTPTHDFPRTEPAELSPWQKGLLTMQVHVLRLSKRAQNGLESIGCHSVADLVELTEWKLLQTKNLGRRSIVELRTKLEQFGLGLAMHLGPEFREQEDELSRRYGPMVWQYLEASFERELIAAGCTGDDLGSRLRTMLSICLEEANPERLQRNIRMLTGFYGFDGGTPSTLNAAGRLHGLTRERVRQLSDKLEETVRGLGFIPSWLIDAVAAVEAIAPCRLEDAAALLRECGVNPGNCDVRGILRAAALFGTTVDLRGHRTGDMAGILCSDRQAHIGEMVLIRARRLTSRYGCFSRDTLLARLDPEGIDAAEWKRMMPLVSDHPDIVWLDARRDWGFIPTVGRSRLFGVVRKTLAVGNRLGIDEIRSAVRRNRHMEGFAPRRDVLLTILRHVPWAIVDGEQVSGDLLDANEEIAGNDRIFFDILTEAGGVLDRYSLVERCTRRGMNLTSCLLLLNYSPVVTPLTPYVFALAGADVAPGTVERITPKTQEYSRVLQDYGWAPDGRLWAVVRASQSTVINGLINIPQAFAEHLQGAFQVTSPRALDEVQEENALEAGDDAPLIVKVSKLMLNGLRPVMIERGVEVGDRILLIFDRNRGTLEFRVGDESVAAEFA